MATQSLQHIIQTELGDIYKPVIKIIGLGGGGSNAINRLAELGLPDIEFIAANTDIQALRNSIAPRKIQLGPRLTKGLGAGGNPKVGEAAAEESYRDLLAALSGADMVFLTAGMGGGTGTGSIAVAARAAREIGAVTVAVVTTPFSFEVGRRQQNARDGLTKLRPHAHTLITVPNDRLLQIAPKSLTLELAFQLSDDVLRQGIQGIAELVTQSGMMNVDFSHVRRVIQNGGGALMSIGFGEGENKATRAIEQALHHPLLESISVDGATGIIANFTGGPSLSFMEVMEGMQYLQGLTHNQAEIIPGWINDPNMEEKCQVILVITGLGATAIEMPSQSAAPATHIKVDSQQSKPQPQPVSVASAIRQQTIMPPPGAAPSTSPRQSAPAPAPQKPVPQPPIQRLNDDEPRSITPADIDLPAFMRRRNH